MARVLVVDDSRETCDLLELLLSREELGLDVDVVKATHPREALNHLQTGTIDVMLTDINLEADLDGLDLSEVGPRVEKSFEAGINVHAVVVDSAQDLRLRVWERGVGLTQACGSGAVAAAVAAHRWGEVGPHVRVHMPGGEAVVDLDGPRALLTGPSTFVAEVVVP